MNNSGPPRESEDKERSRIETTDFGRRIERRRVLRVTVVLFALIITIVSLTNLYLSVLLEFEHKRLLDYLISCSIGGGVVIPIILALGFRFALPIIRFGRVTASGAEPPIEHTQQAIKGIALFPLKFSLAVIFADLFGHSAVLLSMKYLYDFKTSEIKAAAIMGLIMGFTLGAVMYYAAKLLVRPNLEKASSILFSKGIFDFDHARLPLSVKMLLVFTIVVTYILLGAILMGMTQTDRIDRQQLKNRLFASIEQSTGWDTPAVKEGFFIIDADGKLITAADAQLSENEIEYITASKKSGVLTDNKLKKIIVYELDEGLGVVSGAVGYWGETKLSLKHTWNLLLVLILVTLVLCGVSTYLVVNDINEPINKILGYLKSVWVGEKVRLLDAYSDDEIGALASQVVKTTQALEDRTNRSANILESIGNSITVLNETLSGVRSAGEEQAAGINEQIAAVQQALDASGQILVTSRQISENSSEVQTTAENNSNACRNGMDDVSSSLTGFTGLNDYVRNIAGAVMGLGDQFSRVRGVVAIIDEIASQVDLLALNAQIEASESELEGKRFETVAYDIGRLANRTMEATGEIRSLIDSVHKSLKQVVSEAESGVGIVESGSALTDRVGNIFVNIRGHAEQTNELAQGITLITRQQTSASEQLTDTIKNIHDSTLAISQNTEKIGVSMTELEDLAKKLAFLMQKNPDIQ